MLRHLTLVALTTMLAACASTQANTTPYTRLPAKASAEEVEVFTDATPDRAFQEIGLIEVKNFGIGGYGQLVMRAREEAAQLGADAIIVKRTPVKKKEMIATTKGKNKSDRRTNVQTVEKTEPRITVRAIAWKAEMH
jgi:hypothetical protein